MQFYRIETKSNTDLCNVRYLQASDIFDAFKRALKKGLVVLAVMSAADFYYKVVLEEK